MVLANWMALAIIWWVYVLGPRTGKAVVGVSPILPYLSQNVDPKSHPTGAPNLELPTDLAILTVDTICLLTLGST